MAGILSGLQVFANMVGPIPLALLDDNYSALQTTLNTLSTFTNFIVDNGTTNNVNLLTNTSQYVSYTDGLTITTRVAATNTGPATVNVNSMGAKPIINRDGSALIPGQLQAGQFVTLAYDAQRNAFVLLSGGENVTHMAATAPANTLDGDFWFRTTDGRLAIMYDNTWVAACCCGAGGGGVTSGNIFAPPFTVGGPDGALLQLNTDGSAYLGKGLSMGADGHTWLYQGLTTYPLGGLGAAAGTPSIALHGNANSTSSWLSALLDSPDGTETNIGGIGGGSTMSGVSPNTLQILGTGGIALGTTSGAPCMTIGTNCAVNFAGPATFAGQVTANAPLFAPTAAAGTATTQVATTAYVESEITSKLTSVINPPGGTSMAANGYTIMPSGVVLIWGTFTLPSGGDVAVTFPAGGFPSACFSCVCTQGNSVEYGYPFGVINLSRTGFTARNSAGGIEAGTGYYMAIGH